MVFCLTKWNKISYYIFFSHSFPKLQESLHNSSWTIDLLRVLKRAQMRVTCSTLLKYPKIVSFILFRLTNKRTIKTHFLWDDISISLGNHPLARQNDSFFANLINQYIKPCRKPWSEVRTIKNLTISCADDRFHF